MRILGFLPYIIILCNYSLAEEIKRPKYFIAFKKNEGDIINTLTSYTALYPPKDKFYADPMLFKYQGINYIFFEDYDYKKGIISYVTIDQNSSISKSHIALELPIHLSFPHIFYEDGEVYMTPETYNYKSVSLFKAKPFPDNWEHQRVLIQGKYFSDPILFKHNGYYWLFTAVNQDRLCIHYAKTLDSEFLPHPINCRYILGRNAGATYAINGRLIRPTMHCRRGYGRSIILKEILLLAPTHFVEKEIAHIEPNWAPGLDGTHSHCQNEDYVVYDGRRTISLQEDPFYSSEDR